MKLLYLNVFALCLVATGFVMESKLIGVLGIGLILIGGWRFEAWVDSNLRTAYAEGLNARQEPLVYHTSDRVTGAYEAMLAYDQGLRLLLPTNEPNDPPRKLLVGNWQKNPLEPGGEHFVEVGVYNSDGFRAVRRHTRDKVRA